MMMGCVPQNGTNTRTSVNGSLKGWGERNRDKSSVGGGSPLLPMSGYFVQGSET
jgi:hypothetical protein